MASIFKIHDIFPRVKKLKFESLGYELEILPPEVVKLAFKELYFFHNGNDQVKNILISPVF